jgi:hypothetical protein
MQFPEVLMHKTPARFWPMVPIVSAMLCLCLPQVSLAGPATPIEIARNRDQSSSAQIVPARMDGQAGVAVTFEGTDDLHYYAKEETAPAGYKLAIEAQSAAFDFGRAVFPKWSIFNDPLGAKVEVFVGRFTVFVPITTVKTAQVDEAKINVKISGIACTSMVCLPPFEKTLQATINYSQADSWLRLDREKTGTEIVRQRDDYSSVRLQPARLNNQPGIALMFEGSDVLHYYAKQATAPQGRSLKIEAKSPDLQFGQAIVPQWSIFEDLLGNKSEVYAGRFTVFVPITTVKTTQVDKADVEVRISGVACTSTTAGPIRGKRSAFKNPLTPQTHLRTARQRLRFGRR